MPFGNSTLQQAYKHLVLYFLAFSILLLISGFLLFEEKIGFHVEGVVNYYLGDAAQFINAKSIAGIFKIILPHIFVFGLFAMVVLHFLVFTEHKKTKKMMPLIYSTFSIAFLELFSPFLLLQGLEIFAYIKLFSFFALELLFLYIFYLLFRSVLKS